MNEERFKRRVLCLWFPRWALQRIQMARPELRRREVVLYDQQRGAMRVVACSGKHGLRVGMPLVEAMALARIHAERHDPLADRAALLNLAEWGEQFSPLVGIEPPDNLALNVTGIGALFGGEESLTEQIARALARRGLIAQIAIADTFGAAWGLAHYATAPSLPVIVPVGRTRDAVESLPITALRIESDKATILHELGIERAGQLLALPRETIAARFPSQLLLRLDQAIGLVEEPIVSHRPPPKIVADIQLEYPLEDRTTVETIVGRLIEQTCQQLVARQLGAVQLECRLNCEGGPSTSLLVRLHRATACAKHLFDLARLQLEHVRFNRPVVAVKVAVINVARLECWQQELFDSATPRSKMRRHVGLLIDRLSSRLGREAICCALPQADAQPEFAMRYEPLAGRLPGKERPSPWKTKPLHRPLLLEDEPQVLEAISVVPNGSPVQFELGGLHRIARVWGPERIQTGWWRGRYLQRDYYRVETTAGKRFWLFRRLPDAKWFLHGTFD